MKKREIQVFSISFLDLLSGALGAVIILFITVPKSKTQLDVKSPTKTSANQAHVDKDEHQKVVDKNELLSKENDEMKAKLEELKEAIARNTASSSEAKADTTQSDGAPLDVGFKFKGKRIVFLIDVSGSMFDEDRIGQVKAGLKMLVTSMSGDYFIDVIFFPDSDENEFSYLWGNTTAMTPDNKKEVYQFLFDLEPFGYTPTRAALKFALERYGDATDIVLLSDGAPTHVTSSKSDNIQEILQMARNNPNKIQINTIGVGSTFIQDNNSPLYLFMQALARDSGGFFVAF